MKLESLVAHIKANPPRGFVAKPVYNKFGDSIDVFWKDAAYYAEWVNEELTLYKSFDTHEVIGCEIAVSKCISAQNWEPCSQGDIGKPCDPTHPILGFIPTA